MATQIIPQANGTRIGDMTAFGGLVAAFDGTTSKGAVASAGTNTAPATCYAGKDWGSGVSHTVTRFKIWGPNNGAMAGSSSGTLQLYGSNSAPSSPTNGTQLYTGASSGGSAEAQDITSGITVTTAYRYHWATLTIAGGANGFFAQIEFWENATTAYTLTAAVGAFTLTGIAATLNKGKTLTAAVGSFVLTGIAVGWRRGYVMAAVKGTFVLTGISVALRRSINMVAAKGTFVLTGIAASLRKGLTLTAARGTFIFTGIANIMARAIAPASKFKNRISAFRLTKLRSRRPNLED